MAKPKKPSDTPTPKKAAAKKSAAKKAAVKKPQAVEIVAAAATAAASLSAPPVSVPSAQTALPSAEQLHDEIRRRAYELYRARGGQHGSHEADWHRAESEVRSKYKVAR